MSDSPRSCKRVIKSQKAKEKSSIFKYARGELAQSRSDAFAIVSPVDKGQMKHWLQLGH